MFLSLTEKSPSAYFILNSKNENDNIYGFYLTELHHQFNMKLNLRLLYLHPYHQQAYFVLLFINSELSILAKQNFFFSIVSFMIHHNDSY